MMLKEGGGGGGDGRRERRREGREKMSYEETVVKRKVAMTPYDGNVINWNM